MTTHICGQCGTVAHPKTHTKGSFATEFVLWCLFIVPGVLYSIWRHTSRQQVCPACGQPNMLPVNTPKGRALKAELHPPTPEKPKRDAMTLAELIKADMD